MIIMIEVEVKAKIDSFEEMEERLAEIGATKTKKDQEDILHGIHLPSECLLDLLFKIFHKIQHP